MFGIVIPKPLLFTSALGGTIGLAVLTKEWMGGEKYPNDVQADGKIVIVTGSNTGIGKQTAWELARRGAKVYMACRDLNKCEEARKEIVFDTKNKYVYCRKCDLSSIDSVKEFVNHFKQEQSNLHILINNAGVMRTPNSKTKDGIELQLGVNHMGHFLLTNLLLDMLKKSAPSRIINVSSVAHLRGKIKKDDLNSDKSYDPSEAYSQSKVANILFTKELAKRLKDSGVTCNAVHPGIVDTELMRHMGFFNSWVAAILLKPIMWPFIKTPQKGAQTTIFCALDPSLANVTGKYFSNYKETDVSQEAEDEKLSAWLWSVSEKWTRLKQ